MPLPHSLLLLLVLQCVRGLGARLHRQMAALHATVAAPEHELRRRLEVKARAACERVCADDVKRVRKRGYFSERHYVNAVQCCNYHGPQCSSISKSRLTRRCLAVLERGIRRVELFLLVGAGLGLGRRDGANISVRVFVLLRACESKGMKAGEICSQSK